MSQVLSGVNWYESIVDLEILRSASRASALLCSRVLQPRSSSTSVTLEVSWYLLKVYLAARR